MGGTEAKAVGLSWVCGAFHVSWHTDPKTTFINFSLIFFQKLDLFPSHVFTPTNLRLREPVSRVAVQMAVKSVNDHPSLSSLKDERKLVKLGNGILNLVHFKE